MTTNADYHADPAISASHLKAVMQSPYHYWSRFLNPKRPTVEPTSAMRLGSLAHCAVLEPDELSALDDLYCPREVISDQVVTRWQSRQNTGMPARTRRAPNEI